MSALADLLDRLDAAIARAVTSGEVGIVRSLRFHVGGPNSDLPSAQHLLALGDRIFDCLRHREAQSGGAMLCVWEQGQIATVSSALAPRTVVVLTVLGTRGALHLFEQAP